MSNEPIDVHALLREIDRAHFARSPASTGDLERFEERIGWRLDDELRAFYLHCDGADLFGHPNPAFQILPLSQVCRTRVALRGRDEDTAGPASFYALCATQDLDYLSIDIATRLDGRYPIYDCWHELFPEPEGRERIADSFGAFLRDVLKSNGRMYWLGR